MSRFVAAMGVLGFVVAAEADKVVYNFTDPDQEQVVSFYEVSDPVMGGASSGAFDLLSDSVGFGRLSGTVASIPYLGAPGFIKAITCAQKVRSYGICPNEEAFSDVSGFDQFTIRVRSSTPDYTGFKFGFGLYIQDFPVTAEWTDVVLPFNDFTSATSPTKLCKDDPSVCPTIEELSGISELTLWADGVAANVSLDVQWIKATTSAQHVIV